MQFIKIGIVEDDGIIAENLCEMLQECGYAVTKPARRYSEAIAMLEDEQPDLLLLDVRLQGTLDGIDVAGTVEEKFGVPYIFLTANSDFDTISRAKALRPSAFLTKPVTAAQLYAAIEIAMAARQQQAAAALPAGEPEKAPEEFLFIRDGNGSFRKLCYAEIRYAESVENYVRIHLRDGRAEMMRGTFSEFAESEARHWLVRVHRRYAVAPALVLRVLQDDVVLEDGSADGLLIPVSRAMRDALLKRLGIRG